MFSKCIIPVLVVFVFFSISIASRYKNRVIGYYCENHKMLTYENKLACNNMMLRIQYPASRGIHISSRINNDDADNCEFKMCEAAPDDYPYEMALEVLQKNRILHSYFGNIIEPAKDIAISTRFGGPDDNVPYCMSRGHVKFPLQMNDIDGKRRLVFNNITFEGKVFHQAVNFETCVEARGDGENFCTLSSTRLNYISKCVQKYSIISLLSLEPNSADSMVYRRFKIPSTCVCVYNKNF